MYFIAHVKKAIKSKFIKNFSAVLLMHISNFLIPLITFPYVVRSVGAANFGVIAYGLSIMTYISYFVDYGFNLTATKSVAVNQNDTEKLRHIFSKVMTTKMVLVSLSILIMILLCLTVGKFIDNRIAYIMGLTIVIGNTIFPNWFYQGVQEMARLTYINLVIKISQLVLVIAFIKNPSDYVWVLFCYGLANILVGIYALRVLFNRYNVTFKISSLKDVMMEIKSGSTIFLSNISNIITINGSVLILGIYASNNDLGYYSIAEKVLFAFWSILSLFVQIIYPTACKLAVDSKQMVVKYLYKTWGPFSVLVVIGCLIMYFYSDLITLIITGTHNFQISKIMRIMSFVPFVVVLNILPAQLLLVNDKKVIYTLVSYFIAVFSLTVTIIGAKWYGALGASIAVLITHVVMTLLFYIGAFAVRNDIGWTVWKDLNRSKMHIEQTAKL